MVLSHVIVHVLLKMILKRAIRSISYDNRQILLCFQRIFLSLGLVSTNLECVMDAFLKNEYTASIEKWRDDPEIPKSYFSVLFFGLKKHMGLSFKSHFKHLILKVPVWLRGIAFGSVCKIPREDVGQIIF